MDSGFTSPRIVWWNSTTLFGDMIAVVIGSDAVCLVSKVRSTFACEPLMGFGSEKLMGEFKHTQIAWSRLVKE